MSSLSLSLLGSFEANLEGEQTNTARLAAGISLLSAGSLAAVGGTVSYFVLSASNGERCDAEGLILHTVFSDEDIVAAFLGLLARLDGQAEAPQGVA